MNNGRWHWWLVGGLVVCLMTVGACRDDQFQLREDVEPPADVRSGTARALLSLDGMNALYRARHPSGLQLERDAREVEVDGDRLSVGPLGSAVDIDQWSNAIDEGEVHFDIESRDVTVVVPIRVPRQTGIRICQLQLETPAWHLGLAIKRADSPADRLQLVRAPTFDAESTTSSWLDGCPPLQDDSSASSTPSDRLTELVEQYVGRTARSAARDLFEPTPFRALGLLRNTLAVERLSPFDHRRGRIRGVTQLETPDGLELSASGLEGAFDVGLASDRAECIPPVSSTLDASNDVDSIPASMLETRGADMGIALTESLITRLVQAAVSSGFMCRGLQSTDRADTDTVSLSPDRARLETVGLGNLPTSELLRVSLNPGALPEVTLEPDSSSVAMTWRDVTIELYGRVARAPVRLLQVTSSFELRLGPSVSSGGRLEFSIETADVTEASLQSPWQTNLPDETNLSQWARRLVLLIFDEALELPFPLQRESSLTLSGTEIRHHDVVLLMRLRR